MSELLTDGVEPPSKRHRADSPPVIVSGYGVRTVGLLVDREAKTISYYKEPDVDLATLSQSQVQRVRDLLESRLVLDFPIVQDFESEEGSDHVRLNLTVYLKPLVEDFTTSLSEKGKGGHPSTTQQPSESANRAAIHKMLKKTKRKFGRTNKKNFQLPVEGDLQQTAEVVAAAESLLSIAQSGSGSSEVDPSYMEQNQDRPVSLKSSTENVQNTQSAKIMMESLSDTTLAHENFSKILYIFANAIGIQH